MISVLDLSNRLVRNVFRNLPDQLDTHSISRFESKNNLPRDQEEIEMAR